MGASQFDELVSRVTERNARTLTRSSFLVRAARGATVATAAIAAGNLFGVKKAFADDCSCTYPFGAECPNCNGTRCPDPYGPCTSLSGCAGCPHDNGNWVTCTGLGVCGNGYVICWDCYTGSCGSGNVCGCGGTCVCCNCCSPQDVAAEQARIHGLVTGPS